MEREVYPVPDGPSGPKAFFGYLVGRLEYETQNIELVLMFNDARISLFVDGEKKESKVLPDKLFKELLESLHDAAFM